MHSEKSLSFPTLLMMISFASVNAVLFTPGLPNIANFFDITNKVAQYTLTWYLVGYAFGQLIYGPLANRFGRKPALYGGIFLQIGSSLLCVLSGFLESYSVLVLGRFLLALGAGVGLKMTFTLVNECYPPKIAAQKISYLALAFAISPGLSVALGGFLNAHFGWMSCFYASAIYGIFLLLLTLRLPETRTQVDYQALELKHLIQGYVRQFTNLDLLAGGILMGFGGCFVYVFAAVAPFVAISLMGMSSEGYGLANLLPSTGLAIGTLVCAQLTKKYDLKTLILIGISISLLGGILMLFATSAQYGALYALFIPTMVTYMGISFILPSASSYAMSHTEDKAHGSAVMNFLNMGLSMLGVLSLGSFSIHLGLLPVYYICLSVLMGFVYYRMLSERRLSSQVI